jgi:hypothetical protein
MSVREATDTSARKQSTGTYQRHGYFTENCTSKAKRPGLTYSIFTFKSDALPSTHGRQGNKQEE